MEFMNLDEIDLSLSAPTEEPMRQYYYMALATSGGTHLNGLRHYLRLPDECQRFREVTGNFEAGWL